MIKKFRTWRYYSTVLFINIFFLIIIKDNSTDVNISIWFLLLNIITSVRESLIVTCVFANRILSSEVTSAYHRSADLNLAKAVIIFPFSVL